MKWDLLYPSYIQEVDEYSIEYMHRREKEEKEWSELVFTQPGTSEGFSKPSRRSKRPNDDGDEPAGKRRYVKFNYKMNTISQFRCWETQKKASEVRVSEAGSTAMASCQYENCSKSFKGSAARNNLSRHIRTKHEKGIMLKCPNCSKEVHGRRDNLRQHFRNVHSDHELPDWIAIKRRGLTMRKL